MNGEVPDQRDARLARLEDWLGRKRGRVLGALVLAAAFIRLVFCLQIAGGPLPRLHEIIVSDNTFFDTWAKHLSAGDWLQRVPMFPVNPWMALTAQAALEREPGLPQRLGISPEVAAARPALVRALWEKWMGGTAWYQEPAYVYLVALTYRLTGAEPWHVFLWQLLLGLATVLLIHDLARRLFGHTAALGAGALAVLSPVLLINEVALLRDSLVTFATLGLAWIAWWAAETGSRRRWLLLGVACGAAVLVKVVFVLFPVLLVAWLLAFERRTVRLRWSAALAAGAGMAVALLPAVVRNLVVGAAPLALNASGASMLAVYQVADAAPDRIVVSPLFARVLLASDGGFLSSMFAAIRTHASVWDWVALNLSKLAYVWHGYEAPNNVDFYLVAQGAGLVALLPVTVVALAPLAAVGVSRRAWPLLISLVGGLATVILATVMARYRAPVIAVLFPLAGAGLVRVAGWGLARRWVPLGCAALATAAYAAWACSSPVGLPAATRARYYADQGRWATQVREPGLAALCFAEAHRLVPEDAALELRLGQSLVGDREPDRAVPHLKRATARLGSGEAHEALAEALLALGRNDEAVEELRAALAAEPGRESARVRLQGLGRP